MKMMEERLQYLSGKTKVKPKIDLFLFHLSEIFNWKISVTVCCIWINVKMSSICFCFIYILHKLDNYILTKFNFWLISAEGVSVYEPCCSSQWSFLSGETGPNCSACTTSIWSESMACNDEFTVTCMLVK